MSSKTIYDKVQEIKTEKDTKIIPGNIKKDVTVLGVTGTYEGSGGAGPYNMFKFSSVAEMNACQDMETDDLAEVYGVTTSYLAAQQTYNFADVIPAQTFTVTAEEMETYQYVDMYGESSDYYFSFTFPDQGYGQGEINIANMQTYEQQSFTYEKSYDYETGDMTCSLSTSDYNSLKAALASAGSVTVSQIDGQPIVNKVFYLQTTAFGLYKYNGSAWALQNVGMTAVASDLVSGKKAYTNTGVITGTNIPITKLNWMNELYSVQPWDQQGYTYFARLLRYQYSDTKPDFTQYLNNWDMLALKRIKPGLTGVGNEVSAISSVNNVKSKHPFGKTYTGDAKTLYDLYTGNIYLATTSTTVDMYDCQTATECHIERIESGTNGYTRNYHCFKDYVVMTRQKNSAYQTSEVYIMKFGSDPWDTPLRISTPSISGEWNTISGIFAIGEKIIMWTKKNWYWTTKETGTLSAYSDLPTDGSVYWYDNGFLYKKTTNNVTTYKIYKYDASTNTFTGTDLNKTGLVRDLPYMGNYLRQDGDKVITPIGLIDLTNNTFSTPTIPNSGTLSDISGNYLGYYVRKDGKAYILDIATQGTSGTDYNVGEITKDGWQMIYTLSEYSSYPTKNVDLGTLYYEINYSENVIECRSLPSCSSSYNGDTTVADIVGYATCMPTDDNAIVCFWIDGGQYSDSYAFTLGGYNVDTNSSIY